MRRCSHAGRVGPFKARMWIGLWALVAAALPARADEPGDSASLGWIEARAGGTQVFLRPPAGQAVENGAIGGLYRLHEISGAGVELLGAYVSPETAVFLGDPSSPFPRAGLLSTVVVTERELTDDLLHRHALRQLLVEDLAQEKRTQVFLESERFGQEGMRIALPRLRLLAVEDSMVLEGRERLLPNKRSRISYCVEAMLSLQGKPALASMCMTKSDVGTGDMYRLEAAATTWVRLLLARNPTSEWNTRRVIESAPEQIGSTGDAATLINLRGVVRHRRQDVMLAAALLSGTLGRDAREAFTRSSERFARNVRETCGTVRDKVAATTCEAIALEQRLRALEEGLSRAAAPDVATETVQAPPARLVGT